MNDPKLRVSRRNLPHWELAGSTYFLTWRTSPGIELLPNDRSIALSAIQFWDRKRWFVYSAVTMPDHAHALVRPLPLDESRPELVHSLSKLIHSVKSFSAHEISAAYR